MAKANQEPVPEFNMLWNEQVAPVVVQSGAKKTEPGVINIFFDFGLDLAKDGIECIKELDTGIVHGYTFEL